MGNESFIEYILIDEKECIFMLPFAYGNDNFVFLTSIIFLAISELLLRLMRWLYMHLIVDVNFYKLFAENIA